jgi:hypothetical protein
MIIMANPDEGNRGRAVFALLPVIGLLVFILMPMVTRGQSTDALQRALVSEGLPPDQVARIVAKVSTNEAQITQKEGKVDKAPDTTKRFPVVPTTKILAWGRFTTPPTPEQVKEFFPREVPATLKLYLEGKIDQWWVRQDQTGPVFLMNVTSITEAEKILEQLPLGQAKLMVFDYTELGPLTPLHLLIKDGDAPASK